MIHVNRACPLMGGLLVHLGGQRRTCSLTGSTTKGSLSSKCSPKRSVLGRVCGTASTKTAQATTCTVWAVSDLHADTAANRACVEEIAKTASRNDVILLAGDISDDLNTVSWVFQQLSGAYDTVVYVPGNHELWLRQADRQAGLQTSLDKLEAIWGMARACGIRTRPFLLHDTVWIVPLLSWHHRSWDGEPDVSSRKHAWAFSDYSCCEWPADIMGEDATVPGSESLALWMDSWNEGPEMESVLRERMARHDLISLSHFLPRQELIPEKRFLFFPELPSVSGSTSLGLRVKSLSPDVHIFGHSHFAWDTTVDGTRFIQAPLCTARERARRLQSIKVGLERTHDSAQPSTWLPVPIYKFPIVADGKDSWGTTLRAQGWTLLRSGAMPPPYTAAWSEYYKCHGRDPDNTEPAPWVLKRRRTRRAAH